MATQFDSVGSFIANTALSAFRGVVVSSNGGITYAGASDIPIGFVQIDTASGDAAPVKFFAGPGTQKCAITAAPVTPGNTVYAGALGHVSTTGTVTVGKALTSASANDSVIEFVPLR